MSLRDPELKVERAKKHLDELYSAHEDFAKSEPHTLSHTEEGGYFVLTVKVNDPPFELALMAGDFVSCLRSALDHLAWQLGDIASKESKRLAFPIFGENSVSVQESIARQTYGIAEPAICLIKKLQPYNSGNAHRDQPLWILNELWNIDKHRHITLHSGIFNFQLSQTYPKSMGEPQVTQIDGGCEMRFPLAAKEHMDLKPRVVVEVRFGDERKRIEVGLQWFTEVYEFVSKAVIPQFAGFFR